SPLPWIPPSLTSSLFIPLRPPTPPLFPYTTLFRSAQGWLRFPRGRARRQGHRRSHAAHCQGPEHPLSGQHHPRNQSRRQGRETRSEEHTSELQSRENLVCRLLLEKKKKSRRQTTPS